VGGGWWEEGGGRRVALRGGLDGFVVHFLEILFVKVCCALGLFGQRGYTLMALDLPGRQATWRFVLES